MPALTASQLNDLVQTTLKDLGELKFTDISPTLQEYTAQNELLNKNRVTLESGYGIQFNLKVALGGSARNVGLAATDVVDIPDTMSQGSADWRNSTCYYASIGQEMAMNREPRRIVNLMQERRLSSLTDMAELMETNFWGPPVALTDTTTPWGINTWIVKNATQGFNGGVPSGYTTIGGVNPTTYPNWNNYTDQYANVTSDDFVRRARRAATYTKFKPPVQGIPTYNTGDSYGFYTNYAVVGLLEENLDARNDNLGPDVAKNDGETLFRRAPVKWVPILDRDTTNPFYGLNWGVFKTYILRGWWLKETFVPIYPGQHTISATFIDSTYQWVCKDRRRNFVMATGTTYPS